MLCARYRALPVLPHLLLLAVSCVTVIIHTLQKGKLRPREIKYIAQGQDLNLKSSKAESAY
jgi:hypothetical protein